MDGALGARRAGPHPSRRGRSRLLPLLRQLYRRRGPRRREFRPPPARRRPLNSAIAALAECGSGRHRRTGQRPGLSARRQRITLNHRRTRHAGVPAAAPAGAGNPGATCWSDAGTGARFRSASARNIARLGLANYFAGAAMMPYARFLDAAPGPSATIERLAHLFHASLSGWRIACPPCSAAATGACRSFSSASIRPAPSPSAIWRRGWFVCWRRLPAVERASGVRDAGPLPAPAGRDPGRQALSLLARDVSKPGGAFGARCAASPSAWLRDQPRARDGLCRRAGCRKPAAVQNRSGSRAASARARPATSGRCRRWTAISHPAGPPRPLPYEIT